MGHENGGWMNGDQRDADKDAALARLNECLDRGPGAFLGCLAAAGIVVRSSGPALIELCEEMKKLGFKLRVVNETR